MSTFDAISEPLAQRLADGLSRLGAVARQIDWQAAEAEGLTPTQADILRFVASRPAGVRLAAAAGHAGVRSATASDAVTALQRKALVRKQSDASDGRAILLKATRDGQALAARWPASYAPVVAGLDADDQEAMLHLVMEMIRHLHRRNLIAPQRSCVTCKYFRENVAPGSGEPHRCAFVDAPMADRHLRVDCPEHVAAA
ncbi:MarR family winged helix-turn-helix transcriptional regulator [Oceanibacterium hippocampi]|uniref:MarR family protein n=1 Tax=Oceanibacterium hippocampi TaxID=745714 RepID=A0A1Y5THJ1_9PROT|nr:MarR family winged helix-turn-helix transcriptional regulator [Oceanibacterium hippocampi]SLN64064.1 MarR family protein [Oceanibacterium hippocampi]